MHLNSLSSRLDRVRCSRAFPAALTAAALLAADIAHAQTVAVDAGVSPYHTADVSQAGGVAVPVQVDLPPGRSGMTPSVALTWNSQDRGNPDFGRYVSLGLPAIERRKPVADDDRFIFRSGSASTPLVRCLPAAGSSRCISSAPNQPPGSNEYRLERDDGSGLRFFREPADGGDQQWTVVDKAGVRSTYGADESARLAIGSLGAVRWNVTRTVDPAGNAIMYEWANHLPSKIRYTARFQGGVTEAGRYVVTFVQAQLYSTGSDPSRGKGELSNFPGDVRRASHFISEIKVDEIVPAEVDSSGIRPISRLQVSAWWGYPADTAGTFSSEHYFDRLGYSEAGAQSAARRTTVRRAHQETIAPTGPATLSGAVPGSLLTGDFNGDGRQDLAAAFSGTPSYWKILLHTGSSTESNGGFVLQAAAPAVWSGGSGLPSPFVARALDLDGDGRTDIATWDSAANGWQVLLATNTGFSRQTWATPVSLNGASASSVAVVTGDFNADGRSDLVVAKSGSPVTWHLHASSGSAFSLVQWTLSDPDPENVTLDFASDDMNEVQVIVGDFNGDRRADLGWRRDTIVWGPGGPTDNHQTSLFYYLLSPPTLVSGPRTPTWQGLVDAGAVLPRHLYPGYYGRLLVGDYNGDGMTDIGSLGCSYNTSWQSVTCRVWPYLWNLARFEEDFGYWNYEAPFWPQGIVAGDFDGDGRTEVQYGRPAGTGLAWREKVCVVPAGPWMPYRCGFPGVNSNGTGLYGSTGAPAPVCSQYIAIDVNGSGRTDLVCVHGDGKISTILDGPETLSFKNDTGGSTAYTLEGASAFNAVPTAWPTGFLAANPLPFPVQVVTEKT